MIILSLSETMDSAWDFINFPSLNSMKLLELAFDGKCSISNG